LATAIRVPALSSSQYKAGVAPSLIIHERVKSTISGKYSNPSSCSPFMSGVGGRRAAAVRSKNKKSLGRIYAVAARHITRRLIK
jgi:hypothetical protein